MRIKLDEPHSFKDFYIKLWEPTFDKELTAEEVLEFLCQYKLILTRFEDGIVFVGHP